jgi:Ran GTPase-activating protein (RanGAP) involved in mRNA processing and transport
MPKPRPTKHKPPKQSIVVVAPFFAWICFFVPKTQKQNKKMDVDEPGWWLKKQVHLCMNPYQRKSIKELNIPTGLDHILSFKVSDLGGVARDLMYLMRTHLHRMVNLVSLDLSGTRIHIETIVPFLGCFKKLEHIDFSGCVLTRVDMLAQALTELKHLKSIDLSYPQQVSLGGKGVRILSSHLDRIESLMSLDLRDNGIGSIGMFYLSQSIPKLPNFKMLDVRHNWIQQEGLLCVASLQQKMPSGFSVQFSVPRYDKRSYFDITNKFIALFTFFSGSLVSTKKRSTSVWFIQHDGDNSLMLKIKEWLVPKLSQHE